MNLAQASVWNVGTHDLMVREKPKWRTHKGESTDAKYGGGTSRTSDEAPVMGVE